MIYHYVVGMLEPDGRVTRTNGDHNEMDRHLDEWGKNGWRIFHVGVRSNDRSSPIILEKPDLE